MASNTFRVFGILILGLLAYAVLNKFTVGNQPVLVTANAFTTALREQNIRKLNELVDTNEAVIVAPGGKVTMMTFRENHVFKGAFSQCPEMSYYYLELLKKVPVDGVRPVITPDGKLATIELVDKSQMYLRLMDGKWKIIYIAKPDLTKQ